MKPLVILIIPILIIGCDIYDSKQELTVMQHQLLPKYIAHAGGGVRGRRRYTNSLEALNHNYRLGRRFFELDFSWTSDNQLVLIHDWNEIYQILFDVEVGHIPTLNEFAAMQTKHGFTQLTLEKLEQWLANHADAVIITDVKSKNIEALTLIVDQLSTYQHQFIPQIYTTQEYESVKNLGYESIILTLYRTDESVQTIIDFVANNKLLAVAMGLDNPKFEQLLPLLKQHKQHILMHTFNDPKAVAALEKRGVNGFFTDFLY